MLDTETRTPSPLSFVSCSFQQIAKIQLVTLVASEHRSILRNRLYKLISILPVFGKKRAGLNLSHPKLLNAPIAGLRDAFAMLSPLLVLFFANQDERFDLRTRDHVPHVHLTVVESTELYSAGIHVDDPNKK